MGWRMAKAKLVRYADDFVILARYMDGQITVGLSRRSKGGWAWRSTGKDEGAGFAKGRGKLGLSGIYVSVRLGP